MGAAVKVSVSSVSDRFVSVTRAQVLRLLSTSPRAIEAAILALYARQTTDERETATTQHLNGKGFNAADASRFSFLASKLQEGMHFRHATLRTAAERLTKYAGQLASIGMAKQNAAYLADLEAERAACAAMVEDGGDISRLAAVEDEIRAVRHLISNPA